MFNFAHWSAPVRIGATANSRGTTVTGDNSAHVKGSWAELVASSSRNTDMVLLHASNSTNSAKYLLDLGVGSAGSEQVIASNIFFRGDGHNNIDLMLPINIPASSRIAARIQTTPGGSTVAYVAAQLFSGSFGSKPQGVLSTYGADTSATALTAVAPSSSAHTKGSWTQLASSTARLIQGFWIQVAPQYTAGQDQCWLLDIGIGGSGSEVVLVPNIQLYWNSTTNTNIEPGVTFFPVAIPAGTRVSARVQSSIGAGHSVYTGIVGYS